MTRDSVLSGILILLALLGGLWLVISPKLERNAALDKQIELLNSISSEIDEVYVDNSVSLTIADYYEDTGESIIIEQEEEPVPELAVHEITIFETIEPATLPAFTEILVPLPDSEFPETVTGIGILTIDKIDLRLPIMEGISESGLKIAVGRVPETAAIGEIGNAVIAGHRSYDYGKFFNRLDELEIGDTIGYHARSGEIMAFQVFEIAEINPDDQIAFIQPKDEAIITLYTCTPIRIASHRLLVRASKI